MNGKMTLILFSGDLDKALAAFTLATTAASAGMEVTIFFTFWGLNIIKKKRYSQVKGQNPLQRMFNLMSTSKLPISKLNMLGLGPAMMNIAMKKVGMTQLRDLKDLARTLRVKYIACSTSCGFFGLKQEDLVPEVDEFAGASSYLAKAMESKINLFI